MCGIFCYLGGKEALEVAISGLKRLEYRGYDSSGIAALKGNVILSTKAIGKVDVMALQARQVEAFKDVDVIIAQTRWATHGVPSKENAHPHLDQAHTLAVVHNGIIENHSFLKEELQSKGVVFQSDTDTEVIAQLISHCYEGDLLQTLSKVLPRLKGSYAVALIHQDYPGQIFAFTYAMPLVFGFGNSQTFIASDPHAFAGLASEMFFLSDREIAVAQKGSYAVYDMNLKPVAKELRTLVHKAENLSKGDFEHYTIKEIFEQPQTVKAASLSRMLEEYGTAHFDELNLDELVNVERILILACGTSLHAGYIAAYMLEERARIPTQVEISSEFRYKNPIISPQTLVIAISQSGETADTLAAMRELKAKGAKVIAICNVQESSIAREADHCIFLRAGPEIGVCSTKAFTSQVIVLALFALMLGRMRHMTKEQGLQFLSALKDLPEQVKEVLKKADRIEMLAKKYAHFENFFYIGRHYGYPCSLEGALKLKEIAYINANGYAAGEMKHGPIALIGPQTPTVAFCCNHALLDKMMSNVMEVKARSGLVIAVAQEGNTEIEKVADEVIFVPSTVDELEVILGSIALQLFAYYVALERGAEIDQPRNLAKSVTVE